MGPLFPSLPRLRLGQQPSIEDLVQTINQLQAAVERLRGLQGAGGNTTRQLGNAVVVQDQRPNDFLLRIVSGPASGSGSGSSCSFYTWEQVSRQGCNYVVSTPDNALPAFEINDNPNVPDGTVCRAWLAGDGRSVEFEYCCGDTAGSGSGSGDGEAYIDVVTEVCLIASGSGSGSGGPPVGE